MHVVSCVNKLLNVKVSILLKIDLSAWVLDAFLLILINISTTRILCWPASICVSFKEKKFFFTLLAKSQISVKLGSQIPRFARLHHTK